MTASLMTAALGAPGTVLAIRDEMDALQKRVDVLRSAAEDAKRRLSPAALSRIGSPAVRERIAQESQQAIAALEAAEEEMAQLRAKLAEARRAQQRAAATPAAATDPPHLAALARQAAAALSRFANALEHSAPGGS